MAKKILIIEDDNEMRLVEKEAIESCGYETIGVNNPKDGIALAQKEQPDLVIMDIRLPSKKRGIGAAKIIRNNETTSHIPIIFVSGYEVGEDDGEIKSITKCGFISKPFPIKVLIQEIKRFLDEDD